MSYPPPPNQGFHPPPPPPGGQGFPPPPGPSAQGGSGFPPSAQQRFQPPPPPQQGGGQPGGYAPTQQGHQMQQLNTAMGSMSMQGGAPPPPMASQQPPPPPGGGFMGQAPPPPAPGRFQPPPPPGGAAPQMFQAGVQPAVQAPPSPINPPQQPGAMPPGGANSQFYQQAPPAAQMRRTSGGGAGPPGAVGAAAPQPFQETIDYNIKIPERLLQFSTGKIPQTASMAAASKIPLGAVLRPLAPMDPDSDEEICSVQPGNAGIIRCKRCRTYINAFVSWAEHGRRWRCNICAQMNDTPSAYFCHLDEKGLRTDREQRPELSRGVVEFLAPAEYMVRPPQEPSYFFVIDVSATAVRCGMLYSVARAIRESLDQLPGRGRSKVGFITFDNAVHYYNLGSDLSQPQMLVVSDLKELFVPLPDNLLVNLQESRHVIEAFLDSLPEMFVKNPVVSRSCLGPALKAAFTVMKQIGGKMCVFQSILPNLGDGALKVRENAGIMGTPNEIKLLRPEIAWYKDTAIEFSRQQISVDMFVFPYQYMDLAALGELPKYTAGSLHSYVSYNPEKDSERFEGELKKVLTQHTAFEAVMRIRCTKGMRITNFYGNFFIRGTDLLALPNCNSDSVFGFDLSHDEQNVSSNYVTVQAALLYTSSEGERRIRVMTQALPVTSLTTELVASVDSDVICSLLSKQALEVALKTNLDNARIRLQQICVDIIRTCKKGDERTVSGYAVPGQTGGDNEDKPIPENLKLLPLYTLAMMKNVAFRGGTDIHPDERVQAHHNLNRLWVDTCKKYVYPRMFSIHDMDENAGYPTDGEEEDATLVAGRDRVLLPQAVNLSVDRLTSDGLFLLDNGVDVYIWVGRSADPSLVEVLFGAPSLDQVDMNRVVLLKTDPFASRVFSIIEALREDDADPFVIMPRVNVVREGDAGMEARFFWFLIEDRSSFQGGTYSYPEFMQFVNNPGSGQQAPMPPSRGGPPPPRPPPGPGPGMPPPPGPPGHGMGMPPPPGPSQGQGMGMPPPPGPSQGQGMGMPPPPPGPPQGHGMGMPPPPPGPPQGQGMGMPPPGPPPGAGMPPPPRPSQQAQPRAPGYGGPPQAPPPPMGNSFPPPGPPQQSSSQGYGGPPPPMGMGRPPPPGPPPGPPQHSQPPPMHGGPPRGAPPPPPPQYR